MNVQIKMSEIVMLAIVTLLSLAANLPDQMLGGVIDRNWLLVALTGVVVISLFRYLRVLLFLTVVTLAVGANLPEEISESLGVSPVVMLAFLVLLVLISFLNYGFKMLPTEKDRPKHDSPESRQAMLAAVAKGDLTKLHWLLAKNVEVNFSEGGMTPAMLTAEKGYTDIMQILISHGADMHAKNEAGKTPMEIALANGFSRTAEVIHLATGGGATRPGWGK